MYAIYNRNGERMYQFDVFYYYHQAYRICVEQRKLHPAWGLNVRQIN